MSVPFGSESTATSLARPRASRSNRVSLSGSADTDSGRTLIATSRPSFVSFARYTSPIPPAPRGERISYGPKRVPAARLKSFLWPGFYPSTWTAAVAAGPLQLISPWVSCGAAEALHGERERDLGKSLSLKARLGAARFLNPHC